MLGVSGELCKNTVLHVKQWLVEHITRFADWLRGRVHVMQLHWLDNQWGGNQLCMWLLHDQYMRTLRMWSGSQRVEDWRYSAHSEPNIHTVHLQLLMLREHSNSTCYTMKIISRIVRDAIIIKSVNERRIFIEAIMRKKWISFERQ